MKKSRQSPGAGRDPDGRSMEERVRERIRELEALNRELHEEISARVRAEEILLREKAYLEALENSNYSGIVVIDRAGRHTYVNNSFSSMTGYSGRDLYGKGMPYPYWPSRERAENSKRMRQILKGAESPENGCEMRFEDRNGRGVDVTIYSFPFIIRGALQGYLLTVFNITGRKQAEAALRESEESFRSLVGNLPVGVSIIRKGKVVFSNAEQRRILSADGPEKGDGPPQWFDRVHPADADALRALLREDRSGGREAREKEIRILPEHSRDPAEARWVRGRAAPVRHRGEDAILLILMDITRAKEFEQILAVQQKLASLGQFTAGIAHEIRNPLSGINLSFVALERILEREVSGMAPGTREELWVIAGRTKALVARIESTIHKVMGLSRPAPYPVRPVDMNLIAEESLRAAASLIRKSEVTVTKALAEELPPCNADLHLMGHVLSNLIANAVRAMESNQGPRLLDVRSFEKEGQVVLCISDSGPGIPPRIRDRIFEPFFTTHREGHGIGLSISHRIVTEHGGTISIGKSRWGGAEFRISLPSAGESPRKQAPLREAGS